MEPITAIATAYVYMYALAYIFTGILMKAPIVKYPINANPNPLFDRLLMLAIFAALSASVYFNVIWAMLALGVFESFGFMACWWERIVWNVPDAPNAVLQSSMAWGDAACAVALFYLVLA